MCVGWISVRYEYPCPTLAELLVDMGPDDSTLRLVHWQSPHGQFVVTAYAAPLTDAQWERVIPDLIEDQQRDRRTVHREPGPWGDEVVAALDNRVQRFVGVDGPRWMLRGLVDTPASTVRHGASALRDLLRGAVVVRGSQELPERTFLQMELPAELAARIPGIPKTRRSVVVRCALSSAVRATARRLRRSLTCRAVRCGAAGNRTRQYTLVNVGQPAETRI